MPEDEPLFKDFDISILDDPDFKEDSVREEIVYPILRKLGYSATGENRITRSKVLTHPFVYIGSVRRKINIIPDYLLETNSGTTWVLDAKAPGENVEIGKNLEQAFSYAIHPEVRAWVYVLCNGKRLTAFHVSLTEPLLSIEIADINERWEDVEKILAPRFMDQPILRHFAPDFGLYLKKAGVSEEVSIYFLRFRPGMVAKISDNLYTLCTTIPFGDTELFGSFDFKAEQFAKFFESVPNDKKNLVSQALSNSPFRYIAMEEDDSFEFGIEAKLGLIIHSNENESYLPLEIISFLH